MKMISALAGSVMLLLGVTSQADVFMSNPITIASPGGPVAVRVADLNGDGIADLAVLNSAGNSVSIYLGAGNGQFQAPVSYAAGAAPSAMELIDLNGDGRMDLVVLSSAAGTVSILQGMGAGTFAPAQTVAVGNNPTQMDVSASGGFGRIVTVNTGSNSISFIAAQGNGTVSAPVSFNVGNAPAGIVRSDLNGDGVAEYVVSNSGDGTVTVVTNNAAGAPVSSATYGVGAGPAFLGTGDANADGKRDIVVTNAGGNTISVLMGNGDRTLKAAETFTSGANPREVHTADLDQDGETDAVVRNGDGSFSVYLARNGGSVTNYDAGGSGSGLGFQLLDVNGDGNLDIVGVLGNDGRIVVLPGNGDGTFGQARQFAAGAGPATVFGAADLNGDGRMDLVVANTAANTVTILMQLSVPQTLGTVTEFYNSILDNYFITANATEAAAIDNGSAGPGWLRTGGSFKSGGNTYVCRFYGSISPGPNSHFYTAANDECSSLKALQASTPASQKRWNFESLDFVTTVAVNKTCPAGTIPIYRAYNNGFARGVDSNHRITASTAAIAEVVARGWIDEGIVMCAPG